MADAEAITFRGTDQVVKLPDAPDPVRFVGDAVTLSFENAPLSEVTHAVLSDVLGVDYLVMGPSPVRSPYELAHPSSATSYCRARVVVESEQRDADSR